MRCVGLTDDHATRKRAHGNHADFNVVRKFSKLKDAREWKKDLPGKGYEGDTGGKGWRYGYTYSIKKNTKQ